MFVRNRLFAAFSIAFLSGCAAVNAPEGGPRDEKKPLLVGTTPANGTTNFTGKTITLEFDEDVKTGDLNKELIITPNTGNTYSTRTERQNLILEFNKPLAENTTYLLNFRNGIEDITEANKAPTVVLAFSTGNFLDTAQVNGKVTDYITQTPENNITVALYPEGDTGTIHKNKPYYFTKTNADGTFQLQNIKAGNYRIYAHTDKNGNEIYDQESEKIGYLLKPIILTNTLDSIQLKTVRLDTKKPFVLSTEKFTDANVLVYNEGIQKINFRTLDQKPTEAKIPALTAETGNRVTVYATNGNLPSALLALSVDSSGNAGVDTVKLSQANKPLIPAVLTYTVKNPELLSGESNQIQITFPVPLGEIGLNPFTLLEDTVNQVKPTFPEDYQINEQRTQLTLNYTPKAQQSVSLIPDTTQLQAINGKRFKKQIQPLTIIRKATTGSVSGTIKTSYKNYTIELLDEKGLIIKTEPNLKKLSYKNLQPGNYQLRVKIDENNDGKWTLGDKNFQTAPEKLYVYPKPISVRANWEIEDIDLIF